MLAQLLHIGSRASPWEAAGMCVLLPSPPACLPGDKTHELSAVSAMQHQLRVMTCRPGQLG